MIAINGIVVTDKMREAGSKICTDALVVNCTRQLNERIDWSKYGTNSDLLQKYHDRELESIDIIYIAMERAK